MNMIQVNFMFEMGRFFIIIHQFSKKRITFMPHFYGYIDVWGLTVLNLVILFCIPFSCRSYKTIFIFSKTRVDIFFKHFRENLFFTLELKFWKREINSKNYFLNITTLNTFHNNKNEKKMNCFIIHNRKYFILNKLIIFCFIRLTL